MGALIMKALSIKQPYAWDIILGDKPYEYRTWRPGAVRQFLLVSASQPSRDDFGLGLANGYALAIVDITGTPQADAEGMYAWPVRVKNLVTPFPVKGRLHFYDVPDDQIVARPDLADDLKEYQKTGTIGEDSQLYRDYLAVLDTVGWAQMPRKYQKIYSATQDWHQVAEAWVKGHGG
ncbi:hypothetical protein L248_1093 [Schleiferilactobacillus shenzhenensis LY-73]|uniref:ASCH domain-containing protein n=2 Tax=Schleiferilactobacillus shenzhenensis TaxID=1231337 RepID=U4TLR9_9LACO|nr:hypothetical protein L248_1093 [Schleiferilactobacillus shenzhenensis LY-73]